MFIKEQTSYHYMQQAQAMTQITASTLIGDLVDTHPEIIDTLLSYGVHCIGCDVSPYEPLGDGFRSHGMGEEEIKDAIEKLNAIISNHSAEEPINLPTKLNLTITEAALNKIKDFCTKNGKKGLRVGIKRGGCSGYSYVLELVDSPKAHDIVLEEKCATLFIDAASAQQLDGAEIDYVDSLQGAGFKIKNPQATKGCGCGNSFGM